MQSPTSSKSMQPAPQSRSVRKLWSPRTKSIFHLSVVIFYFLSLIFYFNVTPTLAADAGPLWTIAACNKKCEEINKDPNFKCVSYEGVPKDKAGLCYCLAPPSAVKLEMPIGTYQTAYGLVDYIIAIYNWGVKIAALLAIILIMFAGIQWLTAAGSQGAIGKAKTRISNAIAGLILLLGSYYLLDYINPNLTTLSNLQIRMVPTISQSTFFCRNMKDTFFIDKEKYSTNKSDFIPNADFLICGHEYYTIPGGKITESSTQSPVTIDTANNPTCKGNFCAPTVENGNVVNTICGAPYGETIIRCLKPKELCESYSKSKEKSCEEADNAYFKGNEYFKDYGCAKRNDPGANVRIALPFDYYIPLPLPNSGYQDECVSGKILQCPQGYNRVNCTSDDKAKGACWYEDNGQRKGANCYRYLIATDDFIIRQCVNNERAVDGADGICCQSANDYKCYYGK